MVCVCVCVCVGMERGKTNWIYVHTIKSDNYPFLN